MKIEEVATRWQVVVVSADEVAAQKRQFDDIVAQWDVATKEEFEAILAENDVAPDDPEFTPELRAAMIELLEQAK